MKKKILAIACIAICLSIMAYGSLAYFTAEDTATNVIKSGAVKISVEEWILENGKRVPYPEEPLIGIMPGVTVSKIVTVKNEGAEAFIRAKYEMIIKDAKGKVMELDEVTKNSLIIIAPNGAYWLSNAANDGWFYYKDAVGTGVATEALFTEVTFSGINMTNEYQNCTVEIVVDAQAVQVANNGNAVFDAVGWPED